MIPEGYHSVTPSLTVADGRAALDFYTRALDATEILRLESPKSGKLLHAEFTIGDSRMMLSDEFPDWGCVAPAFGTGGLFMIYVADVDEAFTRAIYQGASVIQEPADQFWGDRTARVADPFGYRWTLASHLRDISPGEMTEAVAEWCASEDV